MNNHGNMNIVQVKFPLQPHPRNQQMLSPQKVTRHQRERTISFLRTRQSDLRQQVQRQVKTNFNDDLKLQQLFFTSFNVSNNKIMSQQDRRPFQQFISFNNTVRDPFQKEVIQAFKRQQNIRNYYYRKTRQQQSQQTSKEPTLMELSLTQFLCTRKIDPGQQILVKKVEEGVHQPAIQRKPLPKLQVSKTQQDDDMQTRWTAQISRQNKLRVAKQRTQSDFTESTGTPHKVFGESVIKHNKQKLVINNFYPFQTLNDDIDDFYHYVQSEKQQNN